MTAASRPVPAQAPWKRLCRFVLVSVLLGSAVASAQVTTELQVAGAVARPLTLSVGDLRRLPVRQVDEVRIVGDGRTREEQVRHHGGVLLRDVLDKAEIVEAARHDRRRTVIVATASDGYRAVFSWAELYLSPLGDAVLVLIERDGKPLDEREGRIALISLKDTNTGPRHVRWLQRIDVVRVGS